MSFTPLPSLPSPREAHLWRIFFVLLAMNGPVPVELEFSEEHWWGDGGGGGAPNWTFLA